MGFMDNFTSDSPVTVKQPDYYEMVKEPLMQSRINT